jgi:hypothetical protein
MRTSMLGRGRENTCPAHQDYKQHYKRFKQTNNVCLLAGAGGSLAVARPWHEEWDHQQRPSAQRKLSHNVLFCFCLFREQTWAKDRNCWYSEARLFQLRAPASTFTQTQHKTQQQQQQQQSKAVLHLWYFSEEDGVWPGKARGGEIEQRAAAQGPLLAAHNLADGPSNLQYLGLQNKKTLTMGCVIVFVLVAHRVSRDKDDGGPGGGEAGGHAERRSDAGADADQQRAPHRARGNVHRGGRKWTVHIAGAGGGGVRENKTINMCAYTERDLWWCWSLLSSLAVQERSPRADCRLTRKRRCVVFSPSSRSSNASSSWCGATSPPLLRLLLLLLG